MDTCRNDVPSSIVVRLSGAAANCIARHVDQTASGELMEHSKLQLPAIAQSAIQAYYKGDYEPMFNMISENCLFIGAASDIYHGVAEMIADMDNIADAPTFSMIDARFELVDTGSADQAIVYGDYDIESDFGFDMILAVHQRITGHFSWDGTSWKAVCIHSSNEWEEPREGEIFPTFTSKRTFRYLQKILQESTRIIENRKRVKFNSNGATMLVNPDVILYVESSGKQSVLHLIDRDIAVSSMLSEVEQVLPTTFIRSHRYYLVNVGHIEHIERYQMRLTSGELLPIPERRYKEIRELVLNAMDAPVTMQ